MTRFKKEPGPLRVLFVIDSFRMGGAERITAALLPQLDRTHITPVLCTLNRKDESPLLEKISVLEIPTFNLGARRLLDFRAFRNLMRLLRNQQVELIHAQLQDATIMAAAAGFLTRIPVVATRHLVDDDTSTQRRKLRNRLERFVARNMLARLIAVSEAVRIQYLADASLSPQICRTIYNGIELQNYFETADKSVQCRKTGLPEDAPLIVMVGVIRPGKGQKTAIEAMNLIPGAHLLLVGDGDPHLLTILKQKAADQLQRIHFLGERTDIPDILAASHILILPSESEALPTVLIEAGAAALPSVASDVGGCREIIEHGKTGFLIPPADPVALAEAVNALLGDATLARSMGGAARDLVTRRFSLQRQAAELTALYGEVSRGDHPE